MSEVKKRDGGGTARRGSDGANKRQEQRRAAQARARRDRWLLRLAMLAAALVVVIGAGYLLLGLRGQPNKTAYAARLVADQGTTHIKPGEVHPAYNSTPPTSGWHYESPASWGIRDQPVEDEAQVHNLEHGGVMIQYYCPDGCADLVAQLKGVAGRYKSKVILAPYAKPLPNRIALTAWRWIDVFDDFDEARIVAFIDARKNRGPEQVPD